MLSQLRAFVEQHGFLPRPACSPVALPDCLGEGLRAALAGRVGDSLDAGAAALLENALAGEHAAVSAADPAALEAAMLERHRRDPRATAVWIAADARAARTRLQSLRALAREAGLGAHVLGMYPSAAEGRGRQGSGAVAPLLLLDADSLHRGLLPAHLAHAGWWRRLGLVVLEGAERYSGVHGSHVCHVLYRLRRIVDHYGAAPTYLASLAPVAGAEELLHHLFGRKLAYRAPDALLEPAFDGTGGPTRALLARLASCLAGRRPELALCPEHLVIRASHLKCAAFELPLHADCSYGADGLSAYFEASRRLRREGERLYWIGVEAPAGTVSLREVGVQGLELCDVESTRSIGRIDRVSALEQVYPGAVVACGGRSWMVEDVSGDRRVAVVRRALAGTKSTVRLEIRAALPEEAGFAAPEELPAGGPLALYGGELEVTVHARSYEERCAHSGQLLYSGELSSHPEHLISAGLALRLPPGVGWGEVFAELVRLGAACLVRCAPARPAAGLGARRLTSLGHCVEEAHDGPLVVLFELVPEGIGLVQVVQRRLRDVLELVAAFLAACPCEERGCAACVGAGAEPGDKAGLLSFVRGCLAGKPWTVPVERVPCH